MTEIALHTPLLEKPATRIGGNIFRKQVLPVGQIDYNGRTLTFDRPYLEQLVSSFDARALDSVPLVFADDANQHTMDPSKVRGEVRAFDVTDEGLFATVSLSDDAVAVVDAHPALGVSARILEQHVRQDGRGATTFPAAVQHVLATTQPRVAGMAPWQRVDLSASNVPVVDLTGSTYLEGILMTTPTPPASADPMAAFVATLSPEQRTSLQTAIGTQAAPPAPAATAAPAGGAMDALLDRVLDGKATPEELAHLFGAEPVTAPSVAQPPAAAPVVPASPAVEVTPPIAVGAALAAPAGQALELAQANARIAQLEVTQAAASWAAERAMLTSAGVPPALLDLATPVMVAPGASVITLAGGQQADSKQAMRAMLLAAKGTVDLSAATGHAHGASAEGNADPRTDPAYQSWAKDYTVPSTFTY